MPDAHGSFSDPIDDYKLKQIVSSEIHSATGSLLGSDGGGDLSDRRRQAMEYYLGEPFGNEIDGQSEVIDQVVHDTIEWAMPQLLEIFTAGDEVVRFEPMGPEDEEAAKQATDYVNWIFQRDNNGFQVLQDWFKDALLQKNGIVKVYWEDTDHQDRETYEGLTADETTLLLSDSDVEVAEHTEHAPEAEGSPVQELNIEGFAPQSNHDLTIIRKSKKGRVRVECIPPEEFLIARRSIDIDDDAPFVAHRVKKTVSDLIAEGYDPEIVEKIPSYDESEYNEERLARFEADDEWPVDTQHLDPMMRSVWIYECYLKVDYDNDNYAELRQVVVGGPGYDILSNEPIDEMPFVSITPVKLPHKFFGLSMADEVMDMQLIRSTVLRQTLDNLYHVNNARVVVNDRIDLDDMLTNRVGGVVRASGEEPVQGTTEQLQTASIGHFAYPLMEYLQQLTEVRSGVSRLGQGLDPDALNKTATGIGLIQNSAVKRQQLIARNFADGVKRMFVKIFRLTIKHQDKPRVIRLRNTWVEVDPRHWNAAMDVEINVGLGHGTKDQELFAAMQILSYQEKAIALQQGVQGPLVRLENVHNALSGLVRAAGLKSADPFFSDPENAEQMPQQQQPDPEMLELQAKDQRERQRIQMEHERKLLEIQLDNEIDRAELGLKGAEAGMKASQNGSGVVVKYDAQDSVDEMKDALSQAMVGVQQAMTAVASAVETMSGPKKVIRDESGKVVGVEPARTIN